MRAGRGQRPALFNEKILCHIFLRRQGKYVILFAGIIFLIFSCGVCRVKEERRLLSAFLSEILMLIFHNQSKQRGSGWKGENALHGPTCENKGGGPVEQKTNEKASEKLQWHPAFAAALRIEL